MSRSLVVGLALIMSVAGVGAEAAESLYRTSLSLLPGVGTGTGVSAGEPFTFIAPYFTKVKTRISISITKVTQNSNASQGQNKQPSAPQITTASWYPKVPNAGPNGKDGPAITYSVSCDLRNVIQSKITVLDANPTQYAGEKNVVSVTPYTVVVSGPQDEPHGYIGGAMFQGVSCLPEPAEQSYSLTFSVAPIPVANSRAYLYLRENPFYSDSVNVSIGSDGMLSSSDTSSAQQISAIITELAQTVGASIFHRLAPAQADKRELCNSDIANLVNTAPFFQYTSYPNIGIRGVTWRVRLDTDAKSGKVPEIDVSLIPAIPSNDTVDIEKRGEVDGLVAFFPIPATIEIRCVIPGKEPGVLISPPTVLSLYTERQILDPKRDFLTNPQDTFTFSSGIITGHKFTTQSPARTIVDTVTSPIRALMPSISVTQSTTVQSTGASSSTTSTTTSPPKSQ